MSLETHMDPAEIATKAAEQHPGWFAALGITLAAFWREMRRRKRQPGDLSGRVLRLEERVEEVENSHHTHMREAKPLMDIVRRLDWEQKQARERADEDRDERRAQHAEMKQEIAGLRNEIIAVLSARRKGERP